MSQEEHVRIINKYPNRRLYDTEESCYIKLSEIKSLIEKGLQIRVVDSKSREDITRSILLQIIMEQESQNSPLFTTKSLEDFIRYYSENSREGFSYFIERNLQFFQDQQEQIQRNVKDLIHFNPLEYWTESTNRNMEIWRKMQENFLSSANLPGVKKKDR